MHQHNTCIEACIFKLLSQETFYYIYRKFQGNEETRYLLTENAERKSIKTKMNWKQKLITINVKTAQLSVTEKGNTILRSCEQWYCKWASAAVRCSYCA